MGSSAFPPSFTADDLLTDEERHDQRRYQKVLNLIMVLRDLEKAMERTLPLVECPDGTHLDNPQFVILVEQEQGLLAKLARQGVIFVRRFGSGLGNTDPHHTAWSGNREGDDPSVVGANVIAEQALRLARLEEAVLARADIGRAQGILMERHALSADQAIEAFAAMRHSTHKSQHDIAMDIVGRTAIQPGSAPDTHPCVNSS